MSGRIRTIKPELLEDAVTAGITDAAFRLYIGSLLVADDFGNLRADPRKLRGDVFWAQEEVTTEAVEFLLMELWLAGRAKDGPGLLYLYTVRGQRYAHVRNWEKHQKIDRRGNPRCPKHDLEESEEYSPTGHLSTSPRRVLATDLDLDLDQDHDQRPSALPTSPCSTPTPPGQDAAAPALFGPEPQPIAPEHEVFDHWLASWRTVIGGVRAPKLDEARRKKIRARLREKFSVTDLKRAAQGVWASAWHVDNRHYDIGLVCRDAAHVERFMALAPEVVSEVRPKWQAEPPTPERTYTPEQLAEIDAKLEANIRELNATSAAALTTGGELPGDPRLPKPIDHTRTA